jgi:hypothetical protein
MNSIYQIAQKIGELNVNSIRNQIALQGHNLTGKLSASVEYQVREIPDGVIIQWLLLEYGLPLNSGVFPQNIPFGKPTGAKVSKYIQGLKQFAKQRFKVNDKQALSIAFAIAHKQIKEGMPTFNSFRFSKTRERTKFVQDAIKDTSKEVEKYLSQLIDTKLNEI